MSFESYNPLPEGMVIRKSTGTYDVLVDGTTVPCEISNRLRKELIYPIADPSSIRPRVVAVRNIQTIDPVAVGDRVRFLPGNNGCGLIVEVLPRRSRLSRCEATGPFERHAREQVMVANLDQVIPVMAAAQPEPSWNLLDRYLVSAASLDLPAVICITKLDLARANSNLLDALGEYHRIGYTVVLTSTQTGEGIAELCSHLQGKLSVFMGKSGVGKTTLLNAIQPGLGLRVGEVSGVTGKGRHTTTRLEMFPLDCGGHVVDTPGMREFGLWGVEELDLALLFPEMKPLVGACRFGLDCSHTHEPGCAILKAVKKGAISERRYESMIHLGEE